jgi:hypothetical protein
MVPRFLSRFLGKENVTSAATVERLAMKSESFPTSAHEHPKLTSDGISFSVDQVTRAESPIWTETLADSLNRRLQRKIFVLPEERQSVINVARDSLNERWNRSEDPLLNKGVSLNSFPSGLSSARVKVSFNNGSGQTADLDLVAGFLAISQDPSNLTLSPLISWCAAELPPAEPVEL